MEEQKNIRVIFTEKADSVLSGIMGKYGLEENDAQIVKKVQGKNPFNVVVLNRLTKNFAKGTISEKDFISSLQKDLDIPQQQAAEKIFKDIINNIIPLLKKIPEEELRKQPYIEKNDEQKPELPPTPEKPDGSELVTKTKSPIGAEQVFKKPRPVLEDKPERTEVIKKPIKKNKEIEEFKAPSAAQQKKQDTYREPVE